MKVDIVGMIGLGMVMLLCTILGYGYCHITYEEKVNRYDVDRDGEVTAADYMAIKNYIMESE